MKHLKIFLLLLATLGTNTLYARLQGQARIDALLNVLSGQMEDTNKTKTLFALSLEYSSINPDEGLKMGHRGLDLAKKLKWEKGIANANSALGCNYFIKSDIANALASYFKALEIFDRIGDKYGIAAVNADIGRVYYVGGNYAEALAHAFKALKIAEETGDKTTIAKANGYIGNVYKYQLDYTKSMEYFFRSLKFAVEVDDKNFISWVCNNIGETYMLQDNYIDAILFEEISV